MKLFKKLFFAVLVMSLSMPIFAVDMEIDPSESEVTSGPSDFKLTAEQKAEFALLFQQGEDVSLQTFQMLFQVCSATKAYVHSLDCIFTAIDYDFQTMIEWLYSCGVDFNQQAEGDRNTPVMHAVLMEKPGMVLALSQLDGIDFDKQDFEGDTALHHASLKQDVFSWNSLVAAGADKTIPNYDGILPGTVLLEVPQ